MAVQVSAGLAVPPASKTWPVPLYGQDATEWCWLACAQMIGDMGSAGANLQQCVLAQKYIPGATNCCASRPPPDDCNDGGSDDTIQQLYTDNSLGFQPSPSVGQPLETDLLALLQKGPVQVFWCTPDQGHVALIVGFQFTPNQTALYILNDPWPVGSGQIRTVGYDQLLPTIPSSYDWSWDCYWHF